MRKVYLLTGLIALSSLVSAEENSKWTGQIVPRFEIEDTNNYGKDEPHPMWIKKLNGTLKHKDYSNWTFTCELREAEKNTPHFFDNVDGATEYRVYPRIQYLRNVTDRLALGMSVGDRWQLGENSEGKTQWKMNSYRLAPKITYKITDKLDFRGEVYFIQDIYYDRRSTVKQRNTFSYEITALGFLYRFAPGCYVMADYWEEGNDFEHDSRGEDKKRHQQIRPRLSLKVSEKNTVEFYGRIQILDGEVWKDDGKKKERERHRYGIDFIHRINPSFTVNVGFAVEPNIKVTDYSNNVSKSDWYYYTGRIVYKF